VFTAEIAKVAEKSNSKMRSTRFYLGVLCVLGGERF